MPANSTVTGWLIRLGPLLLVAALAAFWEAASRSGFADPRLLPPLSEVLRVLAGLLQDVRFRGDLGFTLSEIAFIVVLSGIAAARSVPAGLVTAARSFGASRAQIYLRIYLPAMEPLIVEGLRMGLIFTVTGVLLAEMYGSPRGIGRVIFAWGEMFKMPELFAGVLLVVVMTIVCNELLRGIEEFRKSRRRGFR